MNDVIYEINVGGNHLALTMAETFQVTQFGQIANDEISRLETIFYQQGQVTFQLHIMAFDDLFGLYHFICDSLTKATGIPFSVIRHQEAVLVQKEDRVIGLLLPKGGILSDVLLSKEKMTAESILIATRNEGKTAEFRDFFKQFGYQVENLNDHPDLPEVAETGFTFEENARLKAETISDLTQKMVLADDSGLMVDALGGMPGVWSARFSGPDADDESNMQKLLHELAMVMDLKDRSAHFHTTLVLAAPNKESLVVDGEWDGYIAFDKKGEHGFGYDPIFLVGESGQTSAQLTMAEKNKQSHRARALKRLVEVFPKWQEKK